MTTPTDTPPADAPSRVLPTFHRLRVAEVRPLTDDSVEVVLDVPAKLCEAFTFRCGQHLTLRLQVDGIEERRSYSITSAACVDGPTRLAIGVRRVEDGIVSGRLVDGLAAGDELDVMTPSGRFTTQLDPTASRAWLLVAAGSGITPMVSIARTVLESEPLSSVTILYGNRTTSSIMFREELEELKDRHLSRLNIVHVLSRERRGSDALSGRIDAASLPELLRVAGGRNFDQAFLCGPEPMPLELRSVLLGMGMDPGSAHIELFTTGDGGPRLRPGGDSPRDARVRATALVRLHGVEHEVAVHEGERVLAASLRAGLEVPYACTGGVCATCRAHVSGGSIEMGTNHALDDDEVRRGYALTCQSIPTTDRVIIDFDRP